MPQAVNTPQKKNSAMTNNQLNRRRQTPPAAR